MKWMETLCNYIYISISGPLLAGGPKVKSVDNTTSYSGRLSGNLQPY